LKTWWLVAGSLGFFLLVVAAFWALGLFNQPKDDSNAKVLVAVLALVGVLFTETVAVLGLLLKDSVDQRTADLRVRELRQSELESERNHLLARNDQQRNEVDVVIRAVNLVGENNQLSNAHQVGGAVMALQTLGHIDLALALVGDLWPDQGITDSVGMAVVKAGLVDSSARAQTDAAYLLYANAEKIRIAKGYDWPVKNFPDWPHYLPIGGRLSVLLAASIWLRDSVTAEPELLHDPARVLLGALDDVDGQLQIMAAWVLKPIVTHLPLDMKIGPLSVGQISLRLNEIGQLEDVDRRAVSFHDEIERAFQGDDPGERNADNDRSPGLREDG
jgi:hypothetical protein